MTDTSRSEPFGPSLPVVLFLTVMVVTGFLPRLLVAPLLLRISDSLGISFDRASAFFITVSAGFVFGLLVSGSVASRLGHRWTIVAAIGVCGLAVTGLAAVSRPLVFHAGLFVAGLGSGLYPGSGIASLTALTPEVHHGKALAIHESGPNLAFLVAPILVAVLAPTMGWRGVFVVVGATALFAAVAFALFGRASSEPAEPPSFRNLTVFARSRSFWIISALFIVAACGAVGVFSVLPTYLVVEHGLSERLVNMLVGFSRVSSFGSILLAGSLTDRLGFRAVVSAVLGVTGVVTVLIGVASGTILLAAVFLQPMLIGAFFPVGMSALTRSSPPHARNLAVALAIPLANLVGSGIVPRIMSAAGAAGHFRLSFVLL